MITLFKYFYFLEKYQKIMLKKEEKKVGIKKRKYFNKNQTAFKVNKRLSQSTVKF